MTQARNPNVPQSAHGHGRKEDAAAAQDEPTPKMQQAYEDLKKGLVDTDARGASGRPLGSKAPAEGAWLHDKSGKRDQPL